jgi:predicted nuclease with RNAse H fold
MLVAGVDISERRGQTVALLDAETRAVCIVTVESVADVAALVLDRRAAAVAVDSPLQPSRMLLRDPAQRQRYGVPERRGLAGPVYANYRVADFELIRRGMPLYQVPETEPAAPGWMRAGFELARLLTASGYRTPRGPDDHGATMLEVFPDAAFVTLLGERPARKSGGAGGAGRAQRRDALAMHGIHLPDASSHDALDAVAAALTALRWRAGQACTVGDTDEGLIVLPVPRDQLRDRYARGQGEPPAVTPDGGAAS